MSGNEFAKVWHVLNAATGELIDARRAMNPDVEKARLRAALVKVRLAEREVLRLLGAAGDE